MAFPVNYIPARAHIIRMARILKPIGEQKEDDVADNQVFGFKYNDWLHQNEQSFPIMSMKGMKNTFGDYIRTNWHAKKKSFTFSVSRKAKQSHITALLGFINLNLPTLNSMTVKIKRGKKFDTIKGINTTGELRSSIEQETRRRARVYYKVTW